MMKELLSERIRLEIATRDHYQPSEGMTKWNGPKHETKPCQPLRAIR